MSKTYTTTVGLEVHAELNTKSKMFCGCKNDPHDGEPNSYICPICVGHPGTLPVPNEEAITMVLLFGEAVALRGSFLIDGKGIVRHAVINDLPLGRNIDEMIRMVDAMQFTDEQGEVCAAGWQKGDEGMKATTEGVAEYLGKHESEL